MHFHALPSSASQESFPYFYVEFTGMIPFDDAFHNQCNVSFPKQQTTLVSGVSVENWQYLAWASR